MRETPLLALKLEKATWKHSQPQASHRRGPPSYNLKELSSASSHMCLKAPERNSTWPVPVMQSWETLSAEPYSDVPGLLACRRRELASRCAVRASLLLIGYPTIRDESQRRRTGI